MIHGGKLILILAWFGLLFFIGSCTKSKEPYIFDCAKTPSNYNNDIKPIMDAYCVVCHQPGGAYSSVPLTNYAEVRKATDSTKLLPSIRHESSVVAMPQGGNKLKAIEIAKIECWKSNNYPEM